MTCERCNGRMAPQFPPDAIGPDWFVLVGQGGRFGACFLTATPSGKRTPRGESPDHAHSFYVGAFACRFEAPWIVVGWLCLPCSIIVEDRGLRDRWARSRLQAPRKPRTLAGELATVAITPASAGPMARSWVSALEVVH